MQRNGDFRRKGEASVIMSKTHGMSGTPEYRAWATMRQRCNSLTHPEYRYYGGRGITVCESWDDSFEAFFCAMGRRPTSKHSLDRIDNFKGYSPTNCRWATRLEQANNTRFNRRIEYDGRSQTLAEWSRETGIPSHTIISRLDRGKWSVSRAPSTPSRKASNPLSSNQRDQLRQMRANGASIEKLQQAFDISKRTVFNYLRDK